MTCENRYNQLTKQKVEYFTPGRPGMAGDPGQPWLPARCTSQFNIRIDVTHSDTPRVVTFVPIANSILPNGVIIVPPRSTFVYGAEGSPVVFGDGEDHEAGEAEYEGNTLIGFLVESGGPYTSYREVTEEVIVCYPEQPYIPPTDPIPYSPSQMRYDMQMGWSGGAAGIPVLESDGRIEWMAPQTVSGVVVGLNDADIGAHYVDFEHSLFMTNGSIQVRELGVWKATGPTYSDCDVLAIERQLGVVDYLKNGVSFYTSLAPSAGMRQFDVSLYMGDDNIYNPAIIDYHIGQGATELRAIESMGGDYAYSQGITSLHQIESEGSDPPRNATVLRAIEGLGGDYAYGEGRAALHPITSYGEDGFLEPSYSFGHAVLAPIVSGGMGYTGTVGGGDTALHPIESLGSETSYGEGRSVLHPITSYGEDEGYDSATMHADLWIVEQLAAPVVVYVVISEGMTIASVVSVSSLMDAAMQENLTLSLQMSLSGIISATIDELITIGVLAPIFADPSMVWVVNEQGQSTRYENYPFNSFARFGERYYGAAEDGIYLLEGENDQGSPITATIGFGQQQLGSPKLKNLSNCYVTASSDGKLQLRVEAEGKVWVYTARSSSEELKTQRFDLGRGLRANVFTFDLSNASGDDFELASIDFLAAESKRRI